MEWLHHRLSLSATLGARCGMTACTAGGRQDLQQDLPRLQGSRWYEPAAPRTRHLRCHLILLEPAMQRLI